MNYINLVDARKFAQWIGGDLPSEAQWEYSARDAGQVKTYPWGNAPADCSYADFTFNSTQCNGLYTSPVCSFPADTNTLGLCDMSGNVLEWTLDIYQLTVNNISLDGSAYCTTANCDEPAVGTTNRVRRSSGYDSVDVTIAARSPVASNSLKQSTGFRVIRKVKK
jgi:formylglycine-generating enzyme required for sulfatase activity